MNILLFLNMGHGEIILISVILLPFALTLFCLVDIVRSEFKDNTTKLLWVIIVLVAPFIGSIIYLIIGRKHKVLRA
jgi:hypothetical protein